MTGKSEGAELVHNALVSPVHPGNYVQYKTQQLVQKKADQQDTPRALD